MGFSCCGRGIWCGGRVGRFSCGVAGLWGYEVVGLLSAYTIDVVFAFSDFQIFSHPGYVAKSLI